MGARTRDLLRARATVLVSTVALALAAGCGGDADEGVGPTTSSTARATTALRTTTTTAAPPELGLLVSTPEGLDLWTPDETVPVLRERGVAAAFDDLGGGIVFQYATDASPDIVWSPAAARWTLRWADGEEPEPIRRLDAIGGIDEVLVDPGVDHEVTLLDVGTVDGHAAVAFSRLDTLSTPPEGTPLPGVEPPAGFGSSEIRLLVRDLVTGSERDLGTIMSYESDARDVRLGEDLLAIAHIPYSGEPGARVVTGPVAASTVARTYGTVEDWLCTDCVLRQDLPPVGDTIAVYEMSRGADVGRLTIRDAATLAVARELDVSQPDLQPRWLDYDGERAVIAFIPARVDAPGPPPVTRVVLVRDDTVEELPMRGRVTFVTTIPAP